MGTIFMKRGSIRPRNFPSSLPWAGHVSHPDEDCATGNDSDHMALEAFRVWSLAVGDDAWVVLC